MKAAYTSIILLIFCSSCELIVIGAKNERKNEEFPSQLSPLGAINMFLLELKEDNYMAALRILADSSGNRLPASKRIDMLGEISRWQRLVSGKKITSVTCDSIAVNLFKYSFTFDYTGNYEISTIKSKNHWFIVSFVSVDGTKENRVSKNNP